MADDHAKAMAKTATEQENMPNAETSESTEEKSHADAGLKLSLGHVDLTITMKIGGLNESAGLFALDATGNDESKFSEGGWQGWTEENRAALSP